jgi:hypothetical protein
VMNTYMDTWCVQTACNMPLVQGLPLYLQKHHHYFPHILLSVYARGLLAFALDCWMLCYGCLLRQSDRNQTPNVTFGLVSIDLENQTSV